MLFSITDFLLDKMSAGLAIGLVAATMVVAGLVVFVS